MVILQYLNTNSQNSSFVTSTKYIVNYRVGTARTGIKSIYIAF
jgi:hypothetical protein